MIVTLLNSLCPNCRGKGTVTRLTEHVKWGMPQKYSPVLPKVFKSHTPETLTCPRCQGTGKVNLGTPGPLRERG